MSEFFVNIFVGIIKALHNKVKFKCRHKVHIKPVLNHFYVTRKTKVVDSKRMLVLKILESFIMMKIRESGRKL